MGARSTPSGPRVGPVARAAADDGGDGPLSEAARFARRLAHRDLLPAEAATRAAEVFRVNPADVAAALGWRGTAHLLLRRRR